jgi:hypothetical protein
VYIRKRKKYGTLDLNSPKSSRIRRLRNFGFWIEPSQMKKFTSPSHNLTDTKL